tara:strand:+ start:157 stop:702 length:546 start_codon:yes stop_codon:yes gene_type:complete
LSKKNFRRQKNNSPYNDLPLDIAIGIVGILLLSFIYSFSKKTTHTGIPVEVTFPDPNEPRMLAKEVYQKNPMRNIKIEVLNGCGIKGIAAKTSEYLRSSHRIDVIRSENADRYDYPNTLIIGRNENLEKILLVSKSFGISIDNKNIVRHEPNESLGVDVTVILGKDINSYSNIFDYTTNKN